MFLNDNHRIFGRLSNASSRYVLYTFPQQEPRQINKIHPYIL